MATKKKTKPEETSEENAKPDPLPKVPEGGVENTTPEQKAKLIANYVAAAKKQKGIEAELALAKVERSDAVKHLYLACGKKVFKIEGELVTIEKRGETFFLKAMNVDIDDTALEA